MTRQILISNLTGAMLLALLSAAAGDEQPGSGHGSLTGLAGEFRLTSTFWPDPAAGPQVSELTARRALILDGTAIELRVEALLDEPPFHGRGMTGFDLETGEHWTTWVDTTGTDLTVMRGELRSDGSGRLEGRRGSTPLRVEIRTERGEEVHEYFTVDAEGNEVRYLRLVYDRAP